MSRPIAVCLEDLRPPSPDRRYLRCTALVGRAPGLRLDDAGGVRWLAEGAPACELWVSADDRLILYRPQGSGPIVVRRAHRSLDVPPEKPVVLLDKDELDLGGRRLRVHVHGIAPRVHPPEFLRTAGSRLPSKAAAALALGAALGAADCRKDPPSAEGARDIEVRTQPPAEPMTVDPLPPPADAGTSPGDTSAGMDAADPPADAVEALDAEPEIEIRIAPPQMPAPMAEPADTGVPADPAEADAGTQPADPAPPEPEDAAVAAEDARRARRDAARRPPPEIEVRDMPPFVEK